jgi:hypothetical protein
MIILINSNWIDLLVCLADAVKMRATNPYRSRGRSPHLCSCKYLRKLTMEMAASLLQKHHEQGSMASSVQTLARDY